MPSLNAGLGVSHHGNIFVMPVKFAKKTDRMFKKYGNPGYGRNRTNAYGITRLMISVVYHISANANKIRRIA